MITKHRKMDNDESATWIARLSLTLPSNTTISLPESGYQGRFGERDYTLCGKDESYILEVHGFSDRREAEEFLQDLGGSLLWAQVAVSTGIGFNLDPQDVTYCKNPSEAAHNLFGPGERKPVDGAIDGSRAAIYPSDKQIAVLTAGKVSVSIGIPADRLMSALADGIAISKTAPFTRCERLQLASEIYRQSHFESSPKARFLSQMTVLEVLSVRRKRANEIQTLVKNWEHQLQEIREDSEDQIEIRAFESLATSVRALKTESTTEAIRNLVREALESLKDPQASELVNQIGALYKVRSDIAHGRRAVLGQTPATLQEIVGKTLRATMKDTKLLSRVEQTS